jgi:hypothetical protein
MNDPNGWSPTSDPPRDEGLARLLRAADRAVPVGGWERLHTSIMHAARASARFARAASGRDWWDVVLEWRRVAVAASIGAMLAAGALLWQAGAGADELAVGADDAPESVALARVVAAYPDDAVLTSLLQTAGDDALSDWGTR